MNSAFLRLVKLEKDFLQSEFMAPVLSDSVFVKIGGILSKFKVKPINYRGWAILKPINYQFAEYSKECPESLINRYLSSLPKFDFIICDVKDSLGICISNDGRLDSWFPIKIHLSNNLSIFSNIKARFDGQNFIYDKSNRDYSRISGRMKDALEQNCAINNLGLGYKEAYIYAYNKKQKELFGKKENLIRQAISKAGGDYISYLDISNNTTKVNYEVNGQKFSTKLDNNLNIISAGFCLSGTDNIFDMQSLITVIKEGQQKDLINLF